MLQNSLDMCHMGDALRDHQGSYGEADLYNRGACRVGAGRVPDTKIIQIPRVIVKLIGR
jgi:hypothetical protein